jgi:UMP-CMP kinase
MKPLFTAIDIDTYTRSVTSNSVAPVHLTSRYVFERILSVGATPQSVRVLVDGFPRDAARWRYFVAMLRDKGKWSLGDGGTLVVVLKVEREVARERYVKRGRKGDEFEKRFCEHEESIEQIVEAMRRNGLRVVEVDVGEERGVEGMVKRLEGKEDWWSLIRWGSCVSEDEGDLREG